MSRISGPLQLLDIDGESLPQGVGGDIGAYEGATVLDAFGRTVTNGWNATGTGESYSLIRSSDDFSVADGAGSIFIRRAGVTRAVSLPNVQPLKLAAKVRVRTNRAPTAGSQFSYMVARRVAAGTEYRAKLRFSASGNIYIQTTRVVQGKEADLGTEVQVSGAKYAANHYIWLSFEVTGRSPTTLRAKAWMDGQAEPSWQTSAVDATAALQAPGQVGLQAYLSSTTTNAPVRFTFDDWEVQIR